MANDKMDKILGIFLLCVLVSCCQVQAQSFDPIDNFCLPSRIIPSTFPGFDGWPPTPSLYALWSFNTITHDWTQYGLDTNGVVRRPSSGASSYISDLTAGFYLNGQIDAGSALLDEYVQGDVRLRGMVVVNTTDQTAANYTVTPQEGTSISTNGVMQYVPSYGEKGILVVFGGQDDPDGVIGTDDMIYLPMSSISIIDVAKVLDASDGPLGTRLPKEQYWYAQNATGDVPLPRGEFCAVMASAPDGSSHNIYIYAGRNEADNVYYDDIYNLSLPSFTWTKAFGQGDSARYGHTCHFVGQRQMLTIGGDLPWGAGGPCDWENKSVAILDMSTITWGSVYDANAAPYTVPTALTSVIGGDLNGNASFTKPLRGFSSLELAQLFGQNKTSVSPGGLDPPQPRDDHIGAIVGGAVAGTIVIMLLLAAALLWYIRRKFWPKRFENMTETRQDDMIETRQDGTSDMRQDGTHEMRQDGTPEMRQGRAPEAKQSLSDTSPETMSAISQSSEDHH